jgi:hypothetical protein
MRRVKVLKYAFRLKFIVGHCSIGTYEITDQCTYVYIYLMIITNTLPYKDIICEQIYSNMCALSSPSLIVHYPYTHVAAAPHLKPTHRISPSNR